jgi:hypothetical protein
LVLASASDTVFASQHCWHTYVVVLSVSRRTSTHSGLSSADQLIDYLEIATSRAAVFVHAVITHAVVFQ